MKQIKKSAQVNYSQQQMFALVADVEKYPQFLPWCSHCNIQQVTDDGIVAEVGMKLGALSKSFVTRNRHVEYEKISMNLVKGPFSRLVGQWEFKELGEQCCEVTVNIEFDFDNLALSLLIGPIFSGITSSLIDSFVKRAHQIYGA